MSRLYIFTMQEPPLFQDKYRIPSARLPGYDYGQSGMYFITVCTKNRQPYFGNIEVPDNDWNAAFLQATALGKKAAECWSAIPHHTSFVQLDAFILMPDHLHGILLFDKDIVNGADEETRSVASLHAYENQFGPQSRNLASVIRGFKSAVTNYARYHEIEFQWQARFHERVVRNQNELERIQHYILTNPSRWEADQDNGEGLYR
ncbi:transposase [Hymenobacter sp. BT770]|uniref:transposase n=1 Tax=Hymenobacter sp. BT770 TaxID=2886942 RepID=UPI001D102505|nr:transposase [Hymenobacter sp. BT770]MCC3153546.1 transposase [Hymenobacter sp. BT770]MDO3415782.1 transposase [Hymenobacter sp. BT770]